VEKILAQLATELAIRPVQVHAAVTLLDGGATVPFIARYRKEATEGLDDAQLRGLEQRLAYLRELEERRATVLNSIADQGKLTEALRSAIERVATKHELEDLYLPFKPKRRTKAMIARDAGIEPLADLLCADPTRIPAQEAVAFVNAEAGFADAGAVLDGARDILAERWAEDAVLVGKMRECLWADVHFRSRRIGGEDAALPDLDVALRGAVSIARRLQDPLAELVKIDPKSIGVGQYQHDVSQFELARTLDAVVEDCVNAVGVDVNTASAPLLARVSGLSHTVAASIVRRRDDRGAFRDRQELLQVSGLGAKTFEQAAGFLRIRDGDNPLDRTGVHPEAYPVVERILQRTGQPLTQILGRSDALRGLRPEDYADARFGAPTVRDILVELEKPGRDPRPDFKAARFSEGVVDLGDLKEGMLLEGIVSNVAQFGAFVDLGVHQDGLIHVSQLAHRYVADTREVVKAGDFVKVRVLEVDLARKRISLTMKLDAPAGQRSQDGAASDRPERSGNWDRKRDGKRDGKRDAAGPGGRPAAAPAHNAMAAAFARAASKPTARPRNSRQGHR